MEQEVEIPAAGSGVRILGVHFAPLQIPLERRLQTASAFFAIFAILFFHFIWSGLMIACLFTYYFKWVPFLYLAWVVYDWDSPNTGGRKHQGVKKFVRSLKVWEHLRDYFPAQLIKTSDLDPERNYLFCYHPHGVLSFGGFVAFATEALDYAKVFPGLEPYVLTLTALQRLPGYGDIIRSAGGCAATKRNMEYLFRKEKGVGAVLVPGGALEAIEDHEDKVKLVLKRRMGFLKLALRFGVDLVPTFGFGELHLFSQWQSPGIYRFQKWFETVFTFTPVLFRGRGIFQYSFGIVPKRHPITVVTGAPIRVDKVENPTTDQILALQSKYMEALHALYEKYNPIYGDPEQKLEID